MRLLLSALAVLVFVAGCSNNDGPTERIDAVDLDRVLDAFEAALKSPDPTPAAPASVAAPPTLSATYEPISMRSVLWSSVASRRLRCRRSASSGVAEGVVHTMPSIAPEP